MWDFIRKKPSRTGRLERDILAAFDVPIVRTQPQALTTPIILSSPHSGRQYPDAFLKRSQLDLTILRRVEDAYVDEFIHPFIHHNIPTLKALFPRSLVDVNRSPNELPPTIAKTLFPKNPISARAKIGIGVTPTHIGTYSEIYAKPLTVSWVKNRLHYLYEPYHTALADLIDTAKAHFNHAALLDCHSMPGSSSGVNRPDIILGTRHGQSCHPQTSDLLEAAFTSQGFSVTRDYPYAGGFITEHYGRPQDNVEAIQIEINKDLYLDAETTEKTQDFNHIHERIMAALFVIIKHYNMRTPLAAQ